MKRIILAVFAVLLVAKEPIDPIPQNYPYDKDKAKIGKVLFFDPLLSRDETVACVSCHDFNYGGADPRRVSIGVYGKKGNVNSPTVYNAVFNFALFWNGRAKDLYEQLDGPLHSPVEMDMDEKTLLERLNASPYYKELFKEVYHTSTITYGMVKESIVEFEKALTTPNSKFDRYLRGEVNLTSQEYEGYLLFKKLGCITCHNGINLGGNSFQKFGSVIPYEGDFKGDRYEVTKKEIDRGVYRVPTLRNITLTAPYFHNGSVDSLEEAINKVAFHNLGYELSEVEIKKIIAFFETLTGERPRILDED
ncbi:MAG: c-type cytochrome [Epsilonproteobacteria bacterium]|nr:c-type cytochrome [Campylobacterota bacterium]